MEYLAIELGSNMCRDAFLARVGRMRTAISDGMLWEVRYAFLVHADQTLLCW